MMTISSSIPGGIAAASGLAALFMQSIASGAACVGVPPDRVVRALRREEARW
jgi:hypothetical protein